MPDLRTRFVLVGFVLGSGCGIAIAAGLVAPRPIEAQDRTTTTTQLTERVTALEARLQRIEGSITVSSTGAVTIKGPSLEVTSAAFSVKTTPAVFANMITGKTLTVSSVISSSYTPGAGNIW